MVVLGIISPEVWSNITKKISRKWGVLPSNPLPRLSTTHFLLPTVFCFCFLSSQNTKHPQLQCARVWHTNCALWHLGMSRQVLMPITPGRTRSFPGHSHHPPRPAAAGLHPAPACGLGQPSKRSSESIFEPSSSIPLIHGFASWSPLEPPQRAACLCGS